MSTWQSGGASYQTPDSGTLPHLADPSRDLGHVESPSLGRPSYTKQLTRHRIPEACHGPAGIEHEHELSIKAVLTPQELYDHIVEAGVTKSKWRLDKQIAMGLLAGFYIGFSYTTMMLIGGQIPNIQDGPNPGLYNLVLGAFGFPLGLFIICIVGADLFTSNMTYMLTAVHEGKIGVGHLLKSWVLSWFVNLAGCIIMAEIVGFAGFFDAGRSDFVIYLATKKVNYTFAQSFGRGLIANWLVNLAIWLANSAQDVTGKAVGIFLPISAFISIGGEHCIANQFLFSLAKIYHLDYSVGHIIAHSLIPATLGNIVGGGFFVGTMYSLAVGTLFDSIYEKVGNAWRYFRGSANQSHTSMHDRISRSQRPLAWHQKIWNAIVSPHWLHADDVGAVVKVSDPSTKHRTLHVSKSQKHLAPEAKKAGGICDLSSAENGGVSISMNPLIMTADMNPPNGKQASTKGTFTQPLDGDVEARGRR